MQTVFEFGDFRLDAEEKVLRRRDSTCDLTPKAMDVLLVLVRNAGRVVSKEEILRQVWPHSYVEETNLSHHVFRLRRILDESENNKFIETVPKRGYRFVAEIQRPKAVVSASQPVVPRRTWRLRIIGSLAALLSVLICGGAILYYRSSAPEQKPETVTADREPQYISRITNGGKYVAATVSPDGKFVAYAQNYTSGEGMLYIRQIETNTERRLLEPAERNFGTLNFSPNGTFIYYIAYEPGDPSGSVYRIPVIGGQASKMIENVNFMFSLSPDGKRAAFYRYDSVNKTIAVVSAAIDGSGEEQIIKSFDDRETVISGVPAFSPDGRALSFSMAVAGSDFNKPQFSLYVVDLASGSTSKLSEEKWLEIGKTVWLPDNSGLLFIGRRPRNGGQIYTLSYPAGELGQITDELNYYGNYGMGITGDGTTIVADLWDSQAQLWSINSNGSTANAEQLTNGTSDGSVGLASLPDGQVIYTTRSGDDRDLWILRERAGLREGIPLTSDAYSEAGVCSPRDGSHVIFASDRGGSSHLFRSDRDGSNVKQLTQGFGFEGAPDCVPDGSSVLYEWNSAIWKIPSNGGEPVLMTDFECVAPSVSPNGKYFSCIQPTRRQIENATLAILPLEGGSPIKDFPIIPFAFYYRPVRWTPDSTGFVFKRTEKQIGNLWRQDLSGGQPRKISDFKSEAIFNHVYSHDGKNLIVSRGKLAFDTVMLRNIRVFNLNSG